MTLLSKFKSVLPDDQQYKECVILGNGPSLNDTLEKCPDFLEGRALFAVNFFARTSAFEKLQPKYYVICSPEYFVGEQKKEWVEDRLKTFKILAESTRWELHLFVPTLAKKNKEWQRILETNTNIKIFYFNNTPVEGPPAFRHFLFRKNLGMPRPHNVLIPSIFLALNLEFKKIYLAGADHSWTREISVNDQNQVLIGQKHFYDAETTQETLGKNKPAAQAMYLGGTNQTRKLHEVLIKFVRSFQSYWVLKSYAASLDASIINITPGSYIDAFERLKP
ncbi:MAG: hypothetical protein ACR2MX_14980 [Cyclobacteriaceae bacterium]